MRKYALQLYDSMNLDLQLTKKKGLDEEREIECCHQVCSKYWQRLQQALLIHHFRSDNEEIDFFKNLKPLFESSIEFYNLLYHAQLFRPSFDSTETDKFWARESLRLERFRENNRDFYEYIHAKDASLDEVYFLRRNNSNDEFPNANMNEIERKTSTSHGQLLAEYLALEKYSEYVQQQIDKLNNKVIANGNQ
jgi:hypothetical protein